MEEAGTTTNLLREPEMLAYRRARSYTERFDQLMKCIRISTMLKNARIVPKPDGRS
jgi:hypothetical protein